MVGLAPREKGGGVMAKMQPDGVCGCCGKVGPTWYDPAVPPAHNLCDRCQCAQRRWEAWQYHIAHPGAGYPYFDGPPKSPPIRRQ